MAKKVKVSLPILAALPPEMLRNVLEYDFQYAVVNYARERGWLWYAVDKTAQRAVSGHYYALGPPGFPDLVLVRETVLYAELKAERGTTSDDQKVWLAKLQKAGQETAIWKPRNSPEIMERLK